MTTAEGDQPATGAWDGFALRRRRPRWGLLQKFTLGARVPSESTQYGVGHPYLPLQGDELLPGGAVDGGGQNLIGRCAPTTRRVYRD